ncbi:hypothetical protein SKDZ_06G1150 [Saccharomyces kudriavzevii ZP591]|uniref:Nicotinate-nucleotide pyrophosphorylase [carboxylating] n=1 Tax=Saccharomyces cerevisiae x Saccharomyces kudriavzevii (strain VIN7) TaxID=1095631 RepID=H0GUE1_SACCK|nr:Bna6p [Saccharomyces cerevisiae x Saccharomyces kudriavzevii VIN7]CAI4061198.1 hypothetical protein SKDZ_06G1150 [Saccharomyces kudriavzevii ZP591]CAI5266724.1 AIS_HP2_G0016650.mRNA.1.CDS.1 [Saccharomyces cerevisiae]CAI6492369.1 AIS_HP2_G0016650.mRNA.1.CDS.1 [Saccharomyces cerevisiae]
MPVYEHLLPVNGAWRQDVTNWLSEDVPSFDFGGFVVGSDLKEANLYCKQDGILCGVPFAQEVFNQCELQVEWSFKEGSFLEPSKNDSGKLVVATVTGPAKNILLAERTALNVLSRSSGIATASHKIVSLARSTGYKGIIAGTRKTTPGLRRLEKYSMLVGGCDTHRYDLSSMVMLKDNHIWATGSITKAVKNARSVCGFAVKIEVECLSEDEATEAIEAGADVIMLDNFQGDGLKKCAQSLRTKWNGKKHFLLECSGGLKLDNLEEYLCDDIDIYSTSSIHQGTSVIDFSLKLAH